jgi:UDP-N-acetylmuramoyl-tripeptide--D-alanyl-D-alanine ligase
MSAGTPRIPISLTWPTAVTALNASVLRPPTALIESVSTDSRNIAPGALFFALSGERVDGHDFLETVAKQGAAAVVIAARRVASVGPLPASVGVLVVEDPLTALQFLATWYRHQLPAKVIGITGSVGKTTTKELLASALIADAGEAQVLKTQGNLNSQIGLPLMVLLANHQHRYVALEMGLSQFQEMHRLSEIARPNVATITAIAEAHLEFLGDLDGVARAKSEIFDGLAVDGIAVIPTWDQRLRQLGAMLEGRLGRERVWYVGEEDFCVARLVAYTHQSVTLQIQGKTVSAQVPLIGGHHAKNAGIAIACAVAAGADAERAAQGIALAQVPGGRSRLVTEIKGFTVLDDSYNANPASVTAALTSLGLLPGGRRLAVLGDMLELGISSSSDHYKMGQMAARSVDVLFGFGQEAHEYIRGARDAGLSEVYFLDGPIERAIEIVRGQLRPNDRVLLKGSRGMKMERFLAAFNEIE